MMGGLKIMDHDERLTDVLWRMDGKVIEQIAIGVMKALPDIRVLKVPQEGLVMMRGRETMENRPFNLGEVLVTECTVASGEKVGWGCCLGASPERAYHLAVIDLCQHSFPDVWGELENILTVVNSRLEREEAVLSAGVNRTRVKFEVI
jgi:alpha-D-ribose 1-methylphosphonate 5-triphosphate synthase subunit PhnG